MPLSYDKNKIHILKWKENNLDRSREIDRECKYRTYHLKKEQPHEYIFQQECRKFRNIRI